MAGKSGNSSSRIVTGIAGGVAGFAARKATAFLWTRITGKEPPTNPEDPQVALGEALGWALLVGATVQIARTLVTRLASNRIQAKAEEPADLTAG